MNILYEGVYMRFNNKNNCKINSYIPNIPICLVPGPTGPM